MPTAITLPSCLMDCYAVLFPKLDFSRVAFFAGMPFGVSGPTDGFTMASGGPSPDIHVYVDPYEPCNPHTFLVIAHELVHVVQIQGMAGGGHIPGSWAAYYTSQALGCAGRSKCDNPLEKEAYDYANGGGCGTNGKVKSFIDAQLSSQAPCVCLPWPTPTSGYIEALQANSDLVMVRSTVGRTWCTLINWPLDVVAGAFSIFGFSSTGGAIGAAIGTVLGAIGGAFGGLLGIWLGAAIGAVVGGAIGWAIGEVIDWIDDLISGPSARIWFTAFDGKNWVIPDIPVSQNDHSRTSHKPTLAPYNNKLYAAYRASDSDDIWYNVFDGFSWLANDIKITQGGHTKTSEGPALAEYNGKLYLAYRSSANDDLWYNVFDGSSWLANDIKITQSGHTKTSAEPALAVYHGLLYLAYRAGDDEDDLWYNVFDGSSWLANDIKITQNGHTKTSRGPALAVFNDLLFLAYRAGDDEDEMWFNVYDGTSWQAQDTRITRNGRVLSAEGPALASFNQFLFMVYRDNS